MYGGLVWRRGAALPLRLKPPASVSPLEMVSGADAKVQLHFEHVMITVEVMLVSFFFFLTKD